MISPPIIILTEKGLNIRTENSKVNSALSIYSLKNEIDIEKKEIIINGFQSYGKKYRNEFKINLEKKVRENIANFRIYWIDPDNKKNELKIHNGP